MRVFVNPVMIVSISAWDKGIVDGGIGVDAGVVVPGDVDEGFGDDVSRCDKSGRGRV
jgi:hypothetical protein